jgi:hypothetical protein
LKRGRWVLAWLACSLVAFGLFGAPRTTPIHPDEVYWIGSTYYHHLAFERRDWRHPDWMLQPARENPPVAKYVIGLGLALQGQHIVSREMLGCFHLMFVAPGAWGEGAEYAKRVAVVGDMNPTACRRVQGGPGVTKPRALPYLARYVMLATTAVTSLLVFFFGASVATPATGLIASQLLLLHPFMIHASNRTMSDPVALMFGTAAAFGAWTFFRATATADTSASPTSASPTSASATNASPTSASTTSASTTSASATSASPTSASRTNASATSASATSASTTSASTTSASTTSASTIGVVKAALLSGVLLALACGAKMNSLIVVFLFVGAVAVAAGLAWRKGDTNRVILAISAGALSLGLALVLFVVINPAILFDLWGGLVAVVREPQLNTAIQARVMFQLHLTELGEKLAAVATIAGGPLPFLLVAIVAILACVKARRAGMWFVAAWWAIAVACVTAWIPFDWSRYMLPILPPFALLVAHAIVAGIAAVPRKRRGVVNPSEAV